MMWGGEEGSHGIRRDKGERLGEWRLRVGRGCHGKYREMLALERETRLRGAGEGKRIIV